MKLPKGLKEDIKDYIKKRLLERKEVAEIRSPFPLSSQEVMHIIEAIPELKEKELSAVQDPSITAGFIVRVGSRMLDYSIDKRIKDVLS